MVEQSISIFYRWYRNLQLLKHPIHFDFQPIKTILEERKKSCPNTSSETTPKSPRTPTGSTSTPQNFNISVYREIMFLTLVSLGQDNIDLTAFDREYRRAFDNLPAKYVDMAQKSDYPPSHEVVFCRKMFRELLI